MSKQKVKARNNQVIVEINSDPRNVRSLIQDIVRELRGPDGKPSSRETALAITKLQEATFWLAEAAYGEAPDTAEETVVGHVGQGSDTRLRKAAQDLIEYRRRAGPLNFQLEKADDFLREIELALEGRASKPSDVGN